MDGHPLPHCGTSQQHKTVGPKLMGKVTLVYRQPQQAGVGTELGPAKKKQNTQT
eukprot:m.236371 g.236371  ORF g.236371 m.236371 type:complete len:54 (-) comp13921_c1_seq11:261-422(-)